MAYYVYPVYVLASLIVLILSIIFIIYSIHFYKFVKSRIVLIKLLPEENNLNNWTFDLYPFTSSRIWKVCGYAVVCLPATFQQASTIMVCQCKVIKFKSVIPKSACDETKGMVTPALKKKQFVADETQKDAYKQNPVLNRILPPHIVVEKECKCEENVEEKEHDCEESDKTESLLVNTENKEEKKRSNSQSTSNVEGEKSNINTPVKQLPDDQTGNGRKITGLPRKLIQNLRKEAGLTRYNNNRPQSRPQSTVVNIDPELNEHNISIMSIDHLCESDYFIIPEANPVQTLVVFNHPFNSSCPICLDDFELDEEIALLACHHGYHKDCLNKALRQNATCPYCKSESNLRTFRVAEEIPLLWQTMSRRNSSAVNV